MNWCLQETLFIKRGLSGPKMPLLAEEPEEEEEEEESDEEIMRRVSEASSDVLMSAHAVWRP